MAAFRRFEDIDAWKAARELVKLLYETIAARQFGPDADLRRQLTKAGVSVMSNIAEGFGRGNDGDFNRFLWREALPQRCNRYCMFAATSHTLQT